MATEHLLLCSIDDRRQNVVIDVALVAFHEKGAIINDNLGVETMYLAKGIKKAA